MRLRDQMDEIAIPFIGLGEQELVEALPLLSGHLLLLMHAAIGHVGLAADDRLHAFRFRLLIKIDGAIHDAVIRDRHRTHAELEGAVHGGAHLTETIQQAIRRMEVQVNEWFFGCHGDAGSQCRKDCYRCQARDAMLPKWNSISPIFG